MTDGAPNGSAKRKRRPWLPKLRTSARMWLLFLGSVSLIGLTRRRRFEFEQRVRALR
jgi:hypothetical protein